MRLKLSTCLAIVLFFAASCASEPIITPTERLVNTLPRQVMVKQTRCEKDCVDTSGMVGVVSKHDALSKIMAFHVSKTQQMHICFGGKKGQEVHYGLWDGTQLKTERLAVLTRRVSSCQVHVSDDGSKPYVTFFGRDSKRMHLLFRTGENVWSQAPEHDILTYQNSLQLKVDRLGHAHMALYDFEESRVSYAKFDGEKWQVRDLLKLSSPEARFGSFALLSLDPTGQPSVVFQRGSNIEHFSPSGRGWKRSSIPMPKLQAKQRIRLIDFLTDSKGNHHVHFQLFTPWKRKKTTPYRRPRSGKERYQLFHALSSGGTWQVTQAGTASTRGTKMFLTNQDEPVLVGLSGRHYPSKKQKPGVRVYSPSPGGTWKASELASFPHYNLKGTFIHEDKSLVVYHVDEQSRLTQTRYHKGEVSHVTLKQLQSGGTHAELAHGPDRRGHVVFRGENPQLFPQVIYASWTGKSWTQEPLKTGKLMRHGTPHIQVDAQGTPHTLWGERRKMRYAFKRNGEWVYENVTPLPHVRQIRAHAQLVIERHPSTAYISSGETLIFATREPEKGWKQIKVDDKVSRRPPLLSLDAKGAPHLVYLKEGDIGVWHATPDDQGVWQRKLIAGNTEAYTPLSKRSRRPRHKLVHQLKRDRFGRLHLLYQDSNQNMMHAIYHQGTWSHDVVNIPRTSLTRAAMNSVRFDFDSRGKLHLVFLRSKSQFFQSKKAQKNRTCTNIFNVARQVGKQWIVQEEKLESRLCLTLTSASIDKEDQLWVMIRNRDRNIHVFQRNAQGVWDFDDDSDAAPESQPSTF